MWVELRLLLTLESIEKDLVSVMSLIPIPRTMIPMILTMMQAIVMAVVMGPIPILCHALLLAASKSILQNRNNRYMYDLPWKV